MTTTQSMAPATTLAAATESRDADAILAHYAHDATLRVLGRDHPPSSPQTITGRTDIGAHYPEVCGRNIQHDVCDMLSNAAGLAYIRHCRCPDGTLVVCSIVATIRDGLIIRQIAVQAWNET